MLFSIVSILFYFHADPCCSGLFHGVSCFSLLCDLVLCGAILFYFDVCFPMLFRVVLDDVRYCSIAFHVVLCCLIFELCCSMFFHVDPCCSGLFHGVS